jgi:hypothetical protein
MPYYTSIEIKSQEKRLGGSLNSLLNFIAYFTGELALTESS